MVLGVGVGDQHVFLGVGVGDQHVFLGVGIGELVTNMFV